MAKAKGFRVGRVTVYRRGSIWYLRYYENGKRRQIRGNPDKDVARQMAAQISTGLETSVPSVVAAPSTLTLPQLRQAWLDHHEHVLHSSLATIDRYRTASDHLLNFAKSTQVVPQSSQFNEAHADAFVKYLRKLKTSPNGHRNTAKRHLQDKGVKFVLMVCRTLFNYAIKRRHFPAFAQNPLTALGIGRIPIDDAKPIVLLNPQQEEQFFQACDDWQLPIFATLLLTGIRPGELTHLLLPDDVDLSEGWLNICNKPQLGWQVKTRNQRRVPLLPEVAAMLKVMIGEGTVGPVFMRRGFCKDVRNPMQILPGGDQPTSGEQSGDHEIGSRQAHRGATRRWWREIGAIRETHLRNEFMKVTAAIGLTHITTPKMLRHMFATALMEGNVDPLIRNELMGHVPAGDDRGRGPLAMTVCTPIPAPHSFASRCRWLSQIDRASMCCGSGMQINRAKARVGRPS
jgi:integrase